MDERLSYLTACVVVSAGVFMFFAGYAYANANLSRCINADIAPVECVTLQLGKGE